MKDRMGPFMNIDKMQSKDERQNGTIYERCFNAEQG